MAQQQQQQQQRFPLRPAGRFSSFDSSPSGESAPAGEDESGPLLLLLLLSRPVDLMIKQAGSWQA
jgi:hypothetical protein